MADKRPFRVGIMGFGQVGRQIYDLASGGDDVEVVAIADIGGAGNPALPAPLRGNGSDAVYAGGKFSCQSALSCPIDAD